jgi:hypothetical protein
MNYQAIASSVIQYLQDRGAIAVSAQQPAGLLILAHYRGVFLAVQVRKPGRRMTNKQVEFSRQAGRAGVIHIAGGLADAEHTLKIMDTWMARMAPRENKRKKETERKWIQNPQNNKVNSPGCGLT